MNEEMIQKLMTENKEMKLQMQQMQSTIQEICTAMSRLIQLVDGEEQKLFQVQKDLNMQAAFKRNFKYEYWDIMKMRDAFFCPEFRSDEETVRLIVEEKKSLGRFGDGEFAIAYDIPRINFQRVDERLKQRIWQVLNTPNDNFLIGIANNYGNLGRFTDIAADYIRIYMTEETRAMHKEILPQGVVFTDAYISRPYVIFRDNQTDAPKRRFEMLKTIWENKNIIIVEGAQTRLGVGNDLFNNAKRIRRILAPATSSFDRYDDILAQCLKIADEVDMFILAIGPSSGILAFDLSEKGYQAVDVGHMDLEYDWFLAGKGQRVAVPYKYNNEVAGGDQVANIHDTTYQAQILKSFA